MLLLICALTPVLCALLLPLVPNAGARKGCALTAACLTSCFAAYLMLKGMGGEAWEALRLTDTFRFVLRLDGMGKAYLGVAAVLWPPAMLYAMGYMRHEAREGYFFSWYLAAYGAAVLLACADNLFSLYIAYECLTLCTVPLVWHKRDEESTRAALTYMLYLIGGAALGFVAMIGLSGFGLGDFNGAGALAAPEGMWFQALCLLGFFGFAVKAAVLPLCRWLPAASVAPTPVTALLHAVAVVNAGAFSAARFLFNALSPAWLRGTWVQAAMLIFSAATIVYGAARAVREKHVKRRLAWSTVSNLSYMLFGLALLTPQGLAAGLSHMVFHGMTKIILFFCVGAVIVGTGRDQTRQMHGLGKKMPFVFLCFTLAGTSLLGVPPLPGFVSKYALVTAAFDEGGALAVAGSVCLLAAAVLTAVYIFTMVFPAFFMPLRLQSPDERIENPGFCMKASLLVLTLLMILAGLFAGNVMAYLNALAGGGAV